MKNNFGFEGFFFWKLLLLPGPPHFAAVGQIRRGVEVAADGIFGVIARCRVGVGQRGAADGAQRGGALVVESRRCGRRVRWRRVRLVREGRGGRLDTVDAAAQVGHEALAHADFQAAGGGQVAGHFGGAVAEPGAELVGVGSGGGGGAGGVVGETQGLAVAEFVQMTDGEFQHVGLLQFGEIFAFWGQCGAHQLLQFVKAPVDAGATFAFQHRLHNL